MRRSFIRSSWPILTMLGIILIASIGMWGCSQTDETPVAPQPEAVGFFSMSNPQVQSVMAVQNRHTEKLMADPDVIGTATTLGDDGRPAIMLLVTSRATWADAPKTIDGIAVKAVLTDRIVAMKGKPGGGGGTSHTAKQTPPIQLGTSGGWRYDLANGYCCGGTLGSLIQVGGQKRILSNYHVFEADIVNGGNGRRASTGDPVIQPGLIDVACNAGNAQDVATLVVTSSLPGSNVDASSANIVSGMVDLNGAILEVGTISSQTVGASIGQKVKKSGRTTGLSRSTVDALNATVSVSYENECAGGTAFTKTFTGQIIIKNRGSKFLAGGDSGSLMVEDVSNNPRAVGLLFAGSGTLAVANPIDEVLGFFNASMVGN
ncbi:MAG: S1 family peptidase [Gemmatimonadota bacterium]|nr:S1 family peptidase [Gemmatimonadota bacterium]